MSLYPRGIYLPDTSLRRGKSYWDVSVYAEHTEVRANRVAGRIVDKVDKTVTLLEMRCPWIENRGQKDEEKIIKYAPLRLEP